MGELFIRFDKAYIPLSINSEVKVPIQLRASLLRKQLDEEQFLPDTNQLRIMVIGDSYISGIHLPPTAHFSALLADILEEKGISQSVQVLDVAVPKNNTFDNAQFFQHYRTAFKPDYVLWFYNFNDNYQVAIDTQRNSQDQPNKKQQTPRQNVKRVPSWKGKILQLYRKSALFHFLSARIQNELKSRGILLPFGQFYHLIKKQYLPTNPNWKVSQQLLAEVMDSCQSQRVPFILYRMPEFNLLSYPQLFEQIDQELDRYMSAFPYIHHFKGIHDFDPDKMSDYILSKYDGHPSAKAHQVIAQKLGEVLYTLEKTSFNQ